MPNRQPVIFWSNDDPVNWLIFALSGISELKEIHYPFLGYIMLQHSLTYQLIYSQMAIHTKIYKSTFCCIKTLIKNTFQCRCTTIFVNSWLNSFWLTSVSCSAQSRRLGINVLFNYAPREKLSAYCNSITHSRWFKTDFPHQYRNGLSTNTTFKTYICGEIPYTTRPDGHKLLPTAWAVWPWILNMAWDVGP